jgi:RNA polymerase sigma-54 factor
MLLDMRPQSIQKMMLTPKMLLSMHVLQLNIIDLRMFVRGELEENPLLEEEAAEDLPDERKDKLDDQLSKIIDQGVEEQGLPLGAEDSASGGISKEKKDYLESLITKKESLYDHLYWQLQVLSRNDEEKRVGEFIIGNLDGDGFLNMDLESMRASVGTDRDSFKRALTLARSFDPVGVGARNLKESLLLQLVYSGKGNTLLYRIVYSYLEDLEKGHFKKIADLLSVSVEEVERARKRISYLSPKPAASYGGREAVSIREPDVFLNKNNGAFRVEVNEQDLPRLKINRNYKEILRQKDVPQKTEEYIKGRMLSASWIINAMDQRVNTIERVCGYIVDVQNDFLQKGEIAIKPLTLKRVADGLSISEATVSRVVSNKYAQLSNRLLALKSFFAGGLRTADGNLVSNKSVKQRVERLIETEEIGNPLSDGKIMSIFKNEGIKISRRTVTKYREALKILPCHLRKKSRESESLRGGSASR